MKPRIMYIEQKTRSGGGEDIAHARIGRVTFSKTGSTLYYRGRQFQGFIGEDSNYQDAETGEEYLMLNCKKMDEESDLCESGTVEIDDDVRVEYWTKIRNQPERKDETKT